MLDVVVVAILLAQAVRGFRAGFAAFALSLLGLGLGAFAALRFGPAAIAGVPGLAASPAVTAAALALLVLLAALAGDAVLGGLGRLLRGKAGGGVRAVDGALGAVAGVAVAAVVLVLVAAAVTPVLPRPAARAVAGSTILPTLDRALPPAVRQWSSGLSALLDASGLPQVFTGAEPAVPATKADPAVARGAAVQAAADSVVKVRADAAGCGTAAEGSGWVAAPGRVVTNAHVVAGASEVTVREPATGRDLAATVVAFDPKIDLAILAVDGLAAKPLRRAPALAAGTSAVVAGYPLDGPYRLDAARVSAQVTAAGTDIYGRSGAARDVYVVRGTVQPGNSGGPLLTADGRVAGTVFARSTVAPGVGFVLTNAATKALVDDAAADSTPASTGACLAG